MKGAAKATPSPAASAMQASPAPAAFGPSLLPAEPNSCWGQLATQLAPEVRLGPPQDPLEREADCFAGSLLAGTSPVDTAHLAPMRDGAPRSQPTPSSVRETLGREGHRLPSDTREFFESRLGKDLDSVRVHTDSLADHSARQTGSEAYAVSRHLVFREGAYSPNTNAGRHLLAHELTHALYHDPGTLHRTPGAGVDQVEVDVPARRISFVQQGRAFTHDITEVDTTLPSGQSTATVDVARNWLTMASQPVRFRFPLSDNPFLLFAAGQTTVTVIVWNSPGPGETGHGGGPPPASGASDLADGGVGSTPGPAPTPSAPSPEAPAHGLRVTPAANEIQRRLVLRVLSLLHDARDPSDPDAPEVDTYVSLADIEALARLEAHPDRERLIQILRSGLATPRPGADYDYARLIDIAIAQQSIERAGDPFQFRFQSDPDGTEPLVRRPVHGRIELQTGDLVPGKEALFTFASEYREVLFAVPHVFIQWYAVRRPPEGTSTIPEVIDSERVNYIDVRDDSLINDKSFSVTFDAPGDYLVHAFVLHSFFLPNHFELPVPVAQEDVALASMEQQASEGERADPFGTVDSTAARSFSDVASENTAVQIAALGPLGAVALQLLIPEDADAQGIIRHGSIAPGRLDARTGVVQIQGQIRQVETLRARYSREGRTDLTEWADQRLAQLRTLLDAILPQLESPSNQPVSVDGFYVSRRAGVPSGRLRLSSWFRLDPADHQFHATLIDHSEMVRNSHLTFQASEPSLERAYERLFFLLSSTYPNGRMRFSFQDYVAQAGGYTATSRFTQFERVTDTLLNDVQEVAFSAPVSMTVNAVAAILTVFPPTSVAGIAISLIYNGADSALSLMDAQRSGTVSASHYIDIATLAVGIIPLVGGATRLGGTALRVLRVGAELAEFAGDLYVFSDQAYEQIHLLRMGDVQQLATLLEEINGLMLVHAPSSEISRRHDQVRHLQDRIRARALEVFLDMAAQQGLQLASQRAATHLASRVTPRGAPGPGSDPSQNPTPARDLTADEQRAATETGRVLSSEERPGTPADSDPAAIRSRAADAFVEGRLESDPQLSAALPPLLRATVPVIRTTGAHQSVRVRAEHGLFGIRNIFIETGALATPELVAQHVRAVEHLRRYQGVSGVIRSLAEYGQGLLSGLPPNAVQRRRELQLEIDKLPAIIASVHRDADALTAQRGPLSDAEDQAYRERVADLEEQLDQHRNELATLGRDAQPVGFVAALDRITENRLSREVTQGVNAMRGDAHVRSQATSRREFVVDLLRLWCGRVSTRTRGDGVPVPAATQDRIRTGLIRLVLDPVFGRLCLDELHARILTEFPTSVVRLGQASTPNEALRLVALIDEANQRQTTLATSADAARLAIQGHRASTGIATGGTVAGGVLTASASSGSPPQALGGPLVGASPRARTPPPPGAPPANQRYWSRLADGSLNPEAEWADHAERAVLAAAAARLEAQFPGVSPSSIVGELRMHVDQVPCTSCISGLGPGHTASGPLHQFSREFPGVRIIVSFEGATANHVPGNPFVVLGGQFQ